jgi:hypothetical protein
MAIYDLQIKLDPAEEPVTLNPGGKTLPVWPGSLVCLPGSLAAATMHSSISALTGDHCHLILEHWVRVAHLCLPPEQKNRAAASPAEGLSDQQTRTLWHDEPKVWPCGYYPAERYVAPARDSAAAIEVNGQLT